jgi:hypothetical protein
LYSVKQCVVGVVKSAECLSVIIDFRCPHADVNAVPLTVFERNGIFIHFCSCFISCFLLSSSFCEKSKKSRNNSPAATQE